MTLSIVEVPIKDSPAQTEQTAVRRPLCIPLCYRVEGQQGWSAGETVNLGNSEVFFYSQHSLEIDETLEIIFQTSAEILPLSIQRARVVRRILNTWPETRPLVAAEFYS